MKPLICPIDGCNQPRAEFRSGRGKQAFRSHCQTHWVEVLWGEKHPLSKEPRRITRRDGYVLIFADGHTQREHRMVMEAKIGRMLKSGEQVHHINGDRSDNRPENLELWLGNQVTGVRASDFKCPHCGKPYHAQ